MGARRDFSSKNLVRFGAPKLMREQFEAPEGWIEAVREEMEHMQLSQSALAKAVGTKAPQISKLLAAEREVKLSPHIRFDYWPEAHDGAGWYYWDAEYPEEGSVGAFSSEAEARSHAFQCWADDEEES